MPRQTVKLVPSIRYRAFDKIDEIEDSRRFDDEALAYGIGAYSAFRDLIGIQLALLMRQQVPLMEIHHEFLHFYRGQQIDIVSSYANLVSYERLRPD